MSYQGFDPNNYQNQNNGYRQQYGQIQKNNVLCPCCKNAIQIGIAVCPYCMRPLQWSQISSGQQYNYNQQYQQQQYGYPNQNTKHQVKGKNKKQTIPKKVVGTNGKELGMEWFKFIIYFQLFAFCIIALYNGFKQLLGIYNVEGKDVSRIIYNSYPNLRIIDIIFGIIFIVIGVAAIFVRFQLAEFKKNGPIFYMFLLPYGMNYGKMYVFWWAF